MEGAFKTSEKVVIILGITLLLAGFLTFYLTFVTAYFNGMAVQVTINDFGEAHPEMAIASFSLLLGLYAIGTIIRKL
jgi:uncharacterized membrane protein